MPGILSLDKRMTSLSIVGRRVFRIRCCGDFMEQEAVFSLLPNEEIDFGRSLVVLQCSVCHREIDVEFFVGNPTSAGIDSLLIKI